MHWVKYDVLTLTSPVFFFFFFYVPKIVKEVYFNSAIIYRVDSVLDLGEPKIRQGP